jgi:cyclic-di-GMP-binding protein
MPSFDAVLEPNFVEIRNAVDQAVKEIGTRFDFKGTSAALELSEGAKGSKARELTLWGDSDFQLQQVRDVLGGRLSKRGVDLRFIDFTGTPQKMGGDKLKLVCPVKSGIDADTGRKIQQTLKAAKLKVQAAIQGDAVRVTGAKRDELQAAIALLRREIADQPLSFNNFRD